MKIGIGFDVHPFAKGKELILGGEKIPFPKGLSGHSDADVLVHAICDAILGAIGEGDIGVHFPDNDPRYKDISSLKLLKDVTEMMKKKGFIISNLDSIIVAQKPKFFPYFMKMKNNLSSILNINKDLINIKATTTEKLGFIGREEGIAAYCVVLLKKSEDFHEKR
ncbi:MAG: 2-C-methyl-D-erythritol 2,4-cyclodiphosphate synthase [Spirochaetes bacterium]|nr:2-C-methyl-D-erythritol 2,4-cyclodiphosphate synthase [Deltaproteobacteria bacterium]RKY00905.1 MAG: 2-C-methyl-D-erythritol 2,4-cyclodiphosphate synthase [Spirochaetota bacterium]RLA88368.1 MAG: 2-C-methyl-D-erythritol 2,4-cyclodiphosphate synthase [Deltaproteobacteria bacterium]